MRDGRTGGAGCKTGVLFLLAWLVGLFFCIVENGEQDLDEQAYGLGVYHKILLCRFLLLLYC